MRVIRGVAFLAAFHSATLALAADPPACTPQQVHDFDFVAEKQLGVWVGSDRRAAPPLEWTSDHPDHYVGPIADRTKEPGKPGAWGNRNWYPADVVKKTLCGRLTAFSEFAGFGEETDFHVHLDPAPAFSYLVDDLRPITPGTHIYGEATLPDAYTPAFVCRFKDHLIQTSLKAGSCLLAPRQTDACVYGPWVWEEFHHNQPEVHPSEQLWFRDDFRTHWIVALDASTRFGSSDANYCFTDGPGKACNSRFQRVNAEWKEVGLGYRGWAPSSVRAHARFAVAVPEGSGVREFRIDEIDRNDHQASHETQSQTAQWGGDALKVVYPADAEPTSEAHPGLLVSIEPGCRASAGPGGPDRWLTYVDVSTPVEAGQEGQAFMHLAVSHPFATDPQGPCDASVRPTGDDQCTVPDEQLVVVPASAGGGRMLGRYSVDGGEPTLVVLRADGEGALVLRTGVRPPHTSRRHGWTLQRFPLVGSYTPSPGPTRVPKELLADLAERLTDESRLIPTSRSEPRNVARARALTRYERAFGDGEFGYDAQLILDPPGQTLELRREVRCDHGPPESEAQPVLCLDDDRTRISKGVLYGDEDRLPYVARVGVWFPPGFSGSGTLRLSVRDPFGDSEPLEVAFGPPVAPQPGDAAAPPGVPPEAWSLASTELGRDGRESLRQLWGLGPLAGTGAEPLVVSDSPDPRCGRQAQLARLFHLYALSAASDGRIDEGDQSSLAKLLRQFRDAPADDAFCPATQVLGASAAPGG